MLTGTRAFGTGRACTSHCLVALDFGHGDRSSLYVQDLIQTVAAPSDCFTALRLLSSKRQQRRWDERFRQMFAPLRPDVPACLANPNSCLIHMNLGGKARR